MNKALYIEWLDSCSLRNAWNEFDEFKGTKPTLCKTIGFLVDENTDAITLAGSCCAEEGLVSGDMTIPKCAIKKRRVVTWKA